MSMTSTTAGSISRAPRPSSLADVLDLILDKGLVIDAYVRVSVAGIEVLTIDARVVVASVDTYLRFAEAVNRLDLGQTEERGIEALQGLRHGSSQSDSGGGGGSTDSTGSSDSERSGEKAGDAESQDNELAESESAHEGLLGRLAERAKFER